MTNTTVRYSDPRLIALGSDNVTFNFTLATLVLPDRCLTSLWDVGLYSEVYLTLCCGVFASIYLVLTFRYCVNIIPSLGLTLCY